MRISRPCFRKFGSFFCVIGIILLGPGCSTTEPAHNGATLSHWLIAYETSDEGSAEELQAVETVRAIGTNALPFLVGWIADTSSDNYLRAPNGFLILGETAVPALSDLDKLLKGTNELSATLAATSLGYIGAPAAPVLLSALTNENYRVCTDAALVIADLGTNALPAVPIFLQDLQHPNHFSRERAAATLGALRLEPERVVPALADLLEDPSPAARFLALMSLAEFGSEARSAVPEISKLLDSPDESIHQTAILALERIAPEVATNAPPE